jgi:hypothetical protein
MTMSRIARLGWHSPLIRSGFETSGERGIGRDVRRTYLRLFFGGKMVVLRGEWLCNSACSAAFSILGRKLLR